MAFIDRFDEHEEEKECKCFVCGKKPSAFWHGVEVVCVCESCAVEVLPKLLSDSIIANIPIKKLAKDHLYRDFKREKDIKISFDHGVESAILRKLQKYFESGGDF